MWQVALDEADKESDNVILMSAGTFKLIREQLQRLKQDNETIREHCKRVDETNKILYKEKCDLIQENEELKSKMIGKTGFICDCTKVENYRSALEEIREMILVCDEEYCCERCKYHDKCMVDGDAFPDFDKVLINKINKVLNR